MGALPTLFLSHGSPTTPLEDLEVKRFWSELPRRYDGVESILCVSAHWETREPTVSAAMRPETIHDFFGFPQQLYELTYAADGAPDLALWVAESLAVDGITHGVDPGRGLDHGAWVPLMVMYPDAGVPVTQLSIQHHLDPAKHLALGRALAALRHEGVLVIGSGGAVHNLDAFVHATGPDMPTSDWAREFDDWLVDAVVRGDGEALAAYRERAPHAATAHPRADHYVPLLVAFGAAGPGARGTVLHQSWYWGDLALDAYEFGA